MNDGNAMEVSSLPPSTATTQDVIFGLLAPLAMHDAIWLELEQVGVIRELSTVRAIHPNYEGFPVNSAKACCRNVVEELVPITRALVLHKIHQACI